MAFRDQALKANEQYAASFDKGHLEAAPAKGVAVVTCMDARLMPDQFMGLDIGDAHIIRNAGGIVTDDALRSLVITHKLRGTNEVFVINHTGCGMMMFKDSDLQQRLKEDTGQDASGMPFYAFENADDNVKAQVDKIKSSPFIADGVQVHGFVYDVTSGKLRQVV